MFVLRSAGQLERERNRESKRKHVSEQVEEAKEWMWVIYRGYTYLFTARDQFVDEHRLAVLRQFEVFPQLLVLRSGQQCRT